MHASRIVIDNIPTLHEKPLLALRFQELASQSIDFIPNESFHSEPIAPRTNQIAERITEIQAESRDTPVDLPAHLRRMCETELLTHEQESALFREMNLSKYLAKKILSEMDGSSDESCLTLVETLLKDSQSVRDLIIQANTRLVMSIVKKFVSPQLSFDDLLSNGMIKLMCAVEKFDFDRGFRFSTYAYRTISRDAYRSQTSIQTEESRFARDAEEWAFQAADSRNHSSANDDVWEQLRQLASKFLDQLDRRERLIVRSRFALGSHRKVRTFQYLADKLGISKERARQLEKRAIGKLQKMAAEYPIDEIITASMA